MFIDRIDFTLAELEITSGCYKAVTDRSYPTEGITKYYRPQSLKMKNFSGGEIQFCAFTDDEKILYLSGGADVSDLSNIGDSEEETMNLLKGHISSIFVKGTAGETFTSGCTCVIIQE